MTTPVLIVSTGNRAPRQMGVHALRLAAGREHEIRISPPQHSKPAEDMRGEFDCLATLPDASAEGCPVLSGCRSGFARIGDNLERRLSEWWRAGLHLLGDVE